MLARIDTNVRPSLINIYDISLSTKSVKLRVSIRTPMCTAPLHDETLDVGAVLRYQNSKVPIGPAKNIVVFDCLVLLLL